MQEAIMQIGGVLLKEVDLLTNLIQKVDPVRKKKQLHVLKINFHTDDNELEIDGNEEMDEHSSEKYFYIGSADGPSSPQWYATSTSSNYHLTETIFNISKIDMGDELNYKIKRILEKYYINLGDDVKPKYRYCLDIKGCGISDKGIKEIFRDIKNENKGDKEIVGAIKKEFDRYLSDKQNLKSDEIGLYTILIDGQPLCGFEGYRNAVLNEKKSGKKNNGKKKTDINLCCSICGNKLNLSSEFPKTKIKFYTTNQLIFASGLERYEKNMVLCEDCVNKTISGETYIMNNLSTSIAGFTVYLIPHFIFDDSIDKSMLDRISSWTIDSFNTVSNIKAIEKMEKDTKNLLDVNNQNNYFTLNMVFYKANQKATKVQRLIKDVNPYIFSSINRASNESIKKINSAMGYEFRKVFKLESIYYLTPIRLKSGQPMEYNKLLNIYDCIFTGREIQLDFVIGNIMEAASIQYYGKEGYNVRSDGAIAYTVMDGNLYIKFLEMLGCVKGGDIMDASELNVKDDMKRYITEMGYGEQQTAMFLLGYMIGEIGNKQSKSSDEKKKPILNKLNFAGIDKTKIIRLSTDVFDKLNQEKIRRYNEVIYGEFKRLLDSNINNWKLNKHENLFYILSGYGFSSTRYIANKKEDGGIDDEQ